MNTAEVLRLLRKNPVFDPAGEQVLTGLIKKTSVVHYAAGETILHEEEPADRAFVLLEGRAKIFHISPKGDEVVVKLFGPPAVFGEAEIFQQINFQENAAAVEDSHVLIIPRGVFLKFLRENHEATFQLLVDVASRLATATYTEKALAFYPSTVRLAGYLMDYAQWTNPPGAQVWHVELTQGQMAAAIGVTRRSVATDMASWKREGILEVGKHGYVILDLDRLAQYADPKRLAIHYRIHKMEED